MKLYNGDCLEVMQNIPDNSIDFILTDLPYGNSGLNWDKIIPNNLMWQQLKRIRKDNTAIALFGTEPFSSHLRLSNLKEYKYDWIWIKNRCGNFINCKNAPLKYSENICIFSNGATANNNKNRSIYYPQDLIKTNVVKKDIKTNYLGVRKSRTNGLFLSKYKNYPKNILYYNSVNKGLHPTQKPTELLEYLIKTYTKENQIVLDFTMGSGSTGVACVNTNRDFVGIELDQQYYNIAKERIDEKLYNNTS